jgi:hypothetical protein
MFKPTPARTFGYLNQTYTGEELKPHFRQGSMHAFTLPSIVNGILLERKRPVAMSSRIKFTQKVV